MGNGQWRRRETIGDNPGSEEPHVIGPIRAKVVGVDDSDNRGKIQVQVPEVTGDQTVDAEPSNSIMGGGGSDNATYGSLFLPEVGDTVFVKYINGDDQAPVWGPGWFKQGELPAILKNNYPSRRGIVVPSGHYLFFDSSSGGNDAGSGDVELGHRDGARINLASDKSITIVTKDGREIVIDNAGNKISITVQGGGEVDVNADTVNIGNGAGGLAGSPIARYKELKAAYDAHTHDTGVGPSSPPNQPLDTATSATKGNVH